MVGELDYGRLFETKESKERHREQEAQSRKTRKQPHDGDLFMRRNSMTTANIISELEQMHQFYAVASWVPSEEQAATSTR